MDDDAFAERLGNRKFPSRREDPIRSRRAKAKVAKARRERRPSTNVQMDKRNNRLVRNQVMKSQGRSWALLTDAKSATDEKVFTDARSTTDVTDKPGNGSRNRLNNSGNPV